MAKFVGGRFQLIAQLGGGGMADVFLAKLAGKSEFAKLSVIKRLKTIEEEEPEILNMFADEARLCARLNHPSIVQTFEVGEDESGPFLVMEYIEGQSLGRIRSRAARRGVPFPRAMALKIIRETVGALAYAHDLQDHDGTLLKVVHRDVSPENIMVTYAGLTKLVDFGVAKTAASMSKTRAGVLKGKVAYMAPEQARSDESIDERVDVFAVGIILWELLTGKRMWEGMSEAKVFERLLDKDPLPSAKESEPDVPDQLDAICTKAIAKDKEDRFATAHDLLDELEKAVATLDLRASDREIGQFVSGLFEAEREKVKQLVATATAKREDAPSDPSLLDESSDPVLAAASSGPHTTPVLSSKSGAVSPSGGKAGSGARSLPTTTEDGVYDTKVTAAELGKKSPAKLVLAGIGVVAVIVIAVMVGKNLDSTPSTAESSDKTVEPAPIVLPMTTPTSTTMIDPATVDTDVNIDISVKPTNAKIYIDGNRVNGNPYHLKAARGSANHELKAEAEGFETRTMSVAFDRDRTIDFALNRGGGGYVAPRPGPKTDPK